MLPKSYQLVKEASRAYKRNPLSDADHQRLVDNGIIDYQRELDGLNLGSQNIADRYGVNIIRPSAEELPEVVRDHIRGISAWGTPDKAIDARAKSMINGGGYVTTVTNGGRNATVISGENIEPAHAKFKKALDIAGPKGSFNREYANGVMLRHEIDEARNGMRGYQDESKLVNIKNLLGSSSYHPLTSTALGGFKGTHFTPRVVLEESAHVANAPRAVRDAMTKFRGVSGETKVYNKNIGLNYGAVGHPDQRQVRQAEQMASRVTADTANRINGYVADPAGYIKSSLVAKGKSLLGGFKKAVPFLR